MLFNKVVNVSENDIDLSFDKNQLLAWKTDIFANSQIIINQIDYAKVKAKKGEAIDLSWKTKMKSVLRINSVLMIKIEQRMRVLKKIDIENGSDFKSIFFNVAQEKLSAELFNDICEEASMLSQTPFIAELESDLVKNYAA